MAEQVGEIWYSVDLRAEKMMQQVPTVEKALDKLDGEMQKVDKSANQLNTGMTKLAKAIGAVIAASALRDMAQMVQSYQEMAERVQMATSSQEEFEMVQRRLLATANGTYRSLAEAQELYIRTADSLRSMGYTTQQAIDVTDSMSYAFVRNATSADRASAATSALSKSLNTGKVAADQWETITTALPSVINDIATASNRSAEEVRALGAAGKLTARDLAEGLRKSLDDNAQAAANMANNLTDAGVRMRTALTIVLVSLEEQTGALQTFTNALIMGADLMIEFAGSGDAMAAAMTTLNGALTATAAVLAGRMLSSLMASSSALYASTIAAGNKARADLAAAQAAAALAAQQLIQARAAEQAAIGLSTHAAAAQRLTAAQATATSATAALTAAQRTAASVATVASTAMGVLRGAMAFLGGPTGVILLAAAALYTFTQRSNEARVGADQLAKAVNDLGTEQLKLQRTNLGKDIQQFSGEVEQSRARVDRLTQAIKNLGEESITGNRAESLQEEKARLEELEAQQNARIQREKDITAELERRAKVPDTPTGTNSPVAPTTTPDGQKRLQDMRDELELLKVTGEARARLQAIQKLGADATDEERAEAERLAVTIYKLEEAQKAATTAGKTQATDSKKSATELKNAQEQNAEVIKRLGDELRLAGLKGKELAEAQALLKLNDYATPEQVEQVKQLSAELQRVEEIERRRKEFGDGSVRDKVLGDVQPLSGGEFDNQNERYQAEQKAEEERYAAQQQRLREALDLQLVTKAEYQALELEMYQTHSDRMYQIDQARTQMQLKTWSDGFGQMSSDLMAFASTFASENSAMFKVAKAAAVAQTIIETYAAAQKAYSAMASIPYVGPALGIAAAGAAIGAGMARVSAIRSQSMGGGRLYGGPVGANSMHRVNENGQPELLNMANGRQFLIPNGRGNVVSNNDAAGGNGGVPAVTIINNGPPITARAEMDDQGRIKMIVDAAVNEVAGQLATGRGKAAQGMQQGFKVQRNIK